MFLLLVGALKRIMKLILTSLGIDTAMYKFFLQPCQNVLAAGNFALYRQSFATYFILEFQRNLLADRKTQS